VSAAGPPTRPVAGAPTIHAPGGRPACPPAALQTTTGDDDRRPRAKQYWPIRRASNNGISCGVRCKRDQSVRNNGKTCDAAFCQNSVTTGYSYEQHLVGLPLVGGVY